MVDTTVSVHQPNFLPWLKLLDKILASDVYVAYDTAQYTKSEYHARQAVRRHTGTAWLSVPVRHVRGTKRPIQDVQIDNSQPFRRRHLHMLRTSYADTPYFDEVFPLLEAVYAGGQERLVDLNLDLIETLCSYLGVPVRIVRASTLAHQGDRTDRLVQLVRNAGGSEHLTSTYSAGHQVVEWGKFSRAGIGVRAQEFEHPRYDQIGKEFVPNLASVDMLFACGRDTREILASRRRTFRVEVASGSQMEQVR